ncbi:MAG: AAA family ATPase [Candidatus Latescibacterota bacterium]
MPTRPAAEATAEETPLCVRQVSALPPAPPGRPAWLIQDLWGHQAVGLLGGPPKSCKTFLALEMALAVASGTPCLGCFTVPDPGPVLLFAAEDDPVQIRARLAGLAQARGVDFDRLPVFLILAEQLRLDDPTDQHRLADALQAYRPRLLLLDPLVRLHRRDENVAQEVSPLLADLRAWQRRWGVAVLLVHHTRKVHGPLTGQDLRGSTELFAWGYVELHITPAMVSPALC